MANRTLCLAASRRNRPPRPAWKDPPPKTAVFSWSTLKP